MSNLNNYFDGDRPDLIQFINQDARTILEIGGGYGGFSKNFAIDAEYYLVDPVTSRIQTPMPENFTLFSSTYDQVESKIPDGYFDMVICNDVLEHMVQHMDFLIQVKSKLKPTSGRLLISVPNVFQIKTLANLIVRRDWLYEESGLFDKTHVVFFTRKSIARLVANSGYEIEKICLINLHVWKPGQSILKYLLERFLSIFLGREMLYSQIVVLARR